LERSKTKHTRFLAAKTHVVAKSKGGQNIASATLWKERQFRDFRRANNLCFFCGDKFDAAHLHKCTKRNKPQVNAIVLNDLNVELTEETLNHLEVEDVLASKMGQLSLNALSGTNTGDFMRIRALVHNKVMLILVDSGSSHNFVSQTFLQQAGVPSQAAAPMIVRVANGQTLQSSLYVPALEWWAQGHTFHTDMRVLNIGAYDAILGYDWLSAHSPMIYHWELKTLEFKEGAVQVHL
jgi:hypothetical protein